MSDGARRDLRTIVVVAIAAAVTSTAIPAVGGLLSGKGDRATGVSRTSSSTGPARSIVNNAGCDPTSTVYVSCASVRLNLARRGRVLLTMDGAWTTSTAPSLGRCRLVGPGTANQQVNVGETTGTGPDHHFFGLNEVTKLVDAGARTFGLQCREFAGDTISFKEIMLSAVFVGNR